MAYNLLDNFDVVMFEDVRCVRDWMYERKQEFNTLEGFLNWIEQLVESKRFIVGNHECDYYDLVDLL